jgi:Rrf2 family iron-sulfur cluster assembly transcriptional regulator
MLCVSSKGRYATRIMVLLASRGVERSLTKHEIATFEGLTPAYVQQLMSALQAGGLVMSYRGKQGGFRLARAANDVTVREVLRAMEGEIRLAPCHDSDNCSRLATCSTRDIWVGAAVVLEDYFQQTTISELADRARRLGAWQQEQEVISSAGRTTAPR